MAKAQKLNTDLPAVVYARYSSTAQNDASIEQQVEACQSFAAVKKLNITEIYSDRAVSGKSDKRPSFQRMMKDAQARKFGYVIAWKSSRMGRNMLEAMVNDAKLKDCGIRCLYVEEDFDDTAAGRFSLRTMMNVNQFHSENMAEDIMRGLMDNAHQCKANGKPPYGYKRNPDTGLFTLHESQAEVVREIFRRVANGEQYAEIARDLNRRHILSASKGDWSKNSFQAMIRNERYIGVYKYGDVVIEHGMPAIIDKELFYMVQRRIEKRNLVRGRHRNDEEYLLTGKLFCGMCGAMMNGMKAFNRHGQPYYYYSCHRKRANQDCKGQNVRKDFIELRVTQAVQESILTDENIPMMAEQVMRFQADNQELLQLTYYKDRLGEVKRSLANLLKALENGIFNETTSQRMKELEEEQKELEVKITVESKMFKTLTREQVIQHFEGFRDGNPHDKELQRRVIDFFIKAVYLYNEDNPGGGRKMHIVFNYTGADSEYDVTLTKDELENLENESDSDCSLLAPEGVPKRAKANTLRFYRGVFVFTCYIFDD